MKSQAAISKYVNAAKAISPSRILLVVLGVYGAGLLIAPLSPEVNPNLDAILYWVIAASGAVLGLFFGEHCASRKQYTTAKRIKSAATTTAVVALAGNVIFLLNRYIERGVPLGIDIIAAREAIEDSQAGAAGAIGAMMAAFSMFGPTLIRLGRVFGNETKPPMVVLAWLNVIMYVGGSVLIGSRSLFLVFAATSFVAGRYIHALEPDSVAARKSAARRIYIFTGATVTIIFCAGMMLLRLQQMEIDPIATLSISVYATNVKISDWLLDRAGSLQGFTPLIAVFLGMLLYVYHGLYEFFSLYANFQSAHTYGADIGWLPLKIVGILLQKDLSVDYDNLIGYNSGAFTTFLGPTFLDFGWFGIFVIPILFFLLARPFRALSSGGVLWLPFCSLIGTYCIFFPIMNLIDSASGMYPLVAACLIPVMVPGRPLSATKSATDKSALVLEASREGAD